MHVDERYGGLATSLPRFCQAVTDTGRISNRLVAFCAGDETMPSWLPPESVHRFPAGRLRWATDSRLSRSLASLIGQAAVVHIHGLWQEHSFETARLCRRLRKPYIISAHGMLEPWALKKSRWKKRIYFGTVEGRILRGATWLRALTQSEISDYRNLGLRNPIEILPNGIDLPDRCSPGLFWEMFPHLRGCRLIIFLGRVHPKKGIDLLCHAWAYLEKTFPDSHLVIAGPDENHTMDELTRVIRDLGIERRVTFTGILRGPAKWSALAAASLFVLPSYSEGFSIAVLEALGSGLPVIVSRACHFPEVSDAGCGWEVAPQADQLVDAMSEALSMAPNVLSEMGSAGGRLIAQEYTWPRIGERAAALIERWSNPLPQ